MKISDASRERIFADMRSVLATLPAETQAKARADFASGPQVGLAWQLYQLAYAERAYDDSHPRYQRKPRVLPLTFKGGESQLYPDGANDSHMATMFKRFTVDGPHAPDAIPAQPAPVPSASPAQEYAAQRLQHFADCEAHARAVGTAAYTGRPHSTLARLDGRIVKESHGTDKLPQLPSARPVSAPLAALNRAVARAIAEGSPIITEQPTAACLMEREERARVAALPAVLPMGHPDCDAIDHAHQHLDAIAEAREGERAYSHLDNRMTWSQTGAMGEWTYPAPREDDDYSARHTSAPAPACIEPHSFQADTKWPATCTHCPYAEYDGIHKRTPIIAPKMNPTRVILAGELKPGFVVLEAGVAFKVGNVRHTDDGYTYWMARALTGLDTSERELCTLSITGVTVEARA